jgi:DNA-binding XRE family transcriptional regulator
MQVVVKKPHIRLEGEIGGSLVKFLRDQYGEIEVIEDEDDELVEVTKSDWYQSIRETTTSGDNVRAYRQMHGMTQDQLANELGNLTRQNISNMENGHRAISKKMAKKLATLFDVSVEKFI